MPAVIRPVGDERDALMTFLAHERNVLRIAAYGLTDDEANRHPSASAFSIAALLQHVISVERTWAAAIAQRATNPSIGEGAGVTDIVADYERAIAETDAAVATVSDMAQAVPVPVDARWVPRDHGGWNVRWVLLHLIQETARHAGHADIIRESLDGATALPLMAAAEDWAQRRTIQRWSR